MIYNFKGINLYIVFDGAIFTIRLDFTFPSSENILNGFIYRTL